MAAPQQVKAGAGSARVMLDWQTVSGADEYRVFYASEPNIDPLNIGAYTDGDWQTVTQPPLTITGLSNHKAYYFVVTAVRSGREGFASAEVSATPSAPSAALTASTHEVLMLELVNRARLDPSAEAARYGIDLNQGLSPGTLTPEPRPPLAHNEHLMLAARGHSQWMLETNMFGHTGEGGSSITDRMSAAGYVFTGTWGAAENISVTGSIPAPNLTDAIISQHQGLFESASHRINILSAGYRELGVGQQTGDFTFNSGTLPSSMITQNFARSGSGYFITGVVYRDSDHNRRYSAGEGMGNITVSAGSASTLTNNAGAYRIARPNGAYTVAFFGNNLNLTTTATVINGANKKVNVTVTGRRGETYGW
jgi:hypothetical protein